MEKKGLKMNELDLQRGMDMADVLQTTSAYKGCLSSEEALRGITP